MRVDPAAFRQTLLNSITDDGLEELTLRLAKPEYPSAHRSGPGRDAGIDVLSDMELPPQRAWQCKNHQKIDWDDCRASLASAMDDEHPPSHYTFVLPKPLTGPQREFWRRTFKPEQMTKHETLETLDLWDNLAEQLEDRAELVESLTDGALSGYIRQVNAEAAQTGVNPLASAPDLVGDTALLAERAVEMGRADPRFRYETRQREARPGDSAIPDGRIRLGFRAPIGQPREFTVTLRLDNAVQESAAGPREDVELPAISVWFSDTARGAEHRNSVRRQLALGQRVQLRLGPDLGLDAQPLPDRFAGMADPDGILSCGGDGDRPVRTGNADDRDRRAARPEPAHAGRAAACPVRARLRGQLRGRRARRARLSGSAARRHPARGGRGSVDAVVDRRRAGHRRTARRRGPRRPRIRVCAHPSGAHTP